MRGALDNADLPFTRVVQAAGAPRSAAHSPLFQVMCVLQDASVDAEVAMDGLTQEAVEVAPLPACPCAWWRSAGLASGFAGSATCNSGATAVMQGLPPLVRLQSCKDYHHSVALAASLQMDA